MSKELPRHERRPSSPTAYSGSSSASGNPFEQCDMSLKMLLAFISTRVLRGGPRLIVQLVLAFCGLLLLGKFFASPTSTDTLFDSGSRWSWSPFGKSAEDAGFGGPGGVRVVAFGSPDIATPSSGKGAKGKGWTEALCEELRCSSHQSFTPSISLPAQALTSNQHYRDTIEKVQREIEEYKAPGFNYDFLLEQFPISDTVADLSAQIDEFLAQPQTRNNIPKETIWVFSFGTWDIWTLASLPRELGQGIVDLAARALFAQVERVYQATLDNDSVAFSDFWAYQNASLIDKLNNMDREGGDVDEHEIENFRVVIPDLFDVSLTPGWHAQRPAPPSPHTKAEQMTNAAHLTARWNSEIKGRMDEWMRTADPQPENPEEERGKFGYVPASKRATAHYRRSRAEQGLEAAPKGEALRVPFPRRVAAQIDTTSFVREAIVEKQMREYGLTDSTGRGNRTEDDANVFFAEAWTPCIWAKTSETSEAASGGYAACDKPEEYLFHSPFTLSERAIAHTAKIVAGEARRRLAFVDAVDESAVKEGEKAAARVKRHEPRSELGHFQRVLRPNLVSRIVESACPTLDVC
ncbi:hypothetical protein BDP55DRAFT_696563 [Colletotrichum godetiae]|uniref:Uncharacterized protein n=1 Tax=Colletotrichum godetiae TaxID=1209918 RepID=A0AAJ0EPM6_9PEZI|nr:uncharacterized protein BDP55DRAFT_696563 [Colletotrichum godetiae]KAK1671856.1 hypothetical protein BDP55DRAFT_696563 [Colletotrichum godetiae]